MAQASVLCRDCGLCCDGALFSSVALDAAGLDAAREARLPVVKTHKGCRLSLPCAALRGVLCDIYERRPECCVEYECELLLRVQSDRRSRDDARKIIEATRSAHARVRAVVGQIPWWVAHRSAIDAERQNSAWARQNGELLADLRSLARLVRGHFWG